MHSVEGKALTDYHYLSRFSIDAAVICLRYDSLWFEAAASIFTATHADDLTDFR